MSNLRQCVVCSTKVTPSYSDFRTGKLNVYTGKEIVVPHVAEYECTNSECKHSWLPADEEERIDLAIAQNSRFALSSHEIAQIRLSLGFSKKTKASQFLCLNEKAFTKWEKVRSEPNWAYDLLLRLAVHSKSNYSFIKHLHETNFKYDPSDYELICEKLGFNWKFQTVNNEKYIENFPAEKIELAVITSPNNFAEAA